MLYYLLAIFYVLSCLLLLLVVLLQQGKGGDMASAFGGGSSQTAFGARAGATVLTRATSVLGVLFMIGAIVLGIIGRQGPGSIMSGVAGPPPVAAPAPVTSAPTPAPAPVESAKPSAPARAPPQRRLGSRRPRRNWADRRRRRSKAAVDAAAHPRESGGTGRRTSLRGWRSQERGGSNPPFRTKSQLPQ